MVEFEEEFVEVVGDRGTRDEDHGAVTNITRSTYYKGRRRDTT